MKPFVLLLTLLLSPSLKALADVEFFLETAVGTSLTVVVNDQSMTNATGRFRFFDLNPGRAQVLVYRGRMLLTRQWVILSPETRTMAMLHPQYGFRIRGTQRVRGNLFDELPGRNQPVPSWDDQREDAQPFPQDEPNFPPRDSYRSNDDVMSAGEMEQYLKALERTFLSKKLDFIRQTLPKQRFSSAQLVDIIKEFSFTKEKMEVAKLGWDYVADRQNFNLVYEQFPFQSDQNELRAYCDNSR